MLVGGGGLCRQILDLVDAMNRWPYAEVPPTTVLGVLDDGEPDEAPLAAYGVGHIGGSKELATLPADVGYVIAIADPATKRRIDELGGNRRAPVLVHPSVALARTATVGAGTVIFGYVMVTDQVRIGRHVHVNGSTTIGEEATVGDYSTISPQVGISGKVSIGAGVFLGVGAVVNPGVCIGPGAVVGSGAAVIRDVRAGSTVVGVPAAERRP